MGIIGHGGHYDLGWGEGSWGQYDHTLDKVIIAKLSYSWKFSANLTDVALISVVYLNLLTLT